MTAPVPPVDPAAILGDLSTYVAWSESTVGNLADSNDALQVKNTALTGENARLTQELADCKAGEEPPPPPVAATQLGTSFGGMVGSTGILTARVYTDNNTIGKAVSKGANRLNLTFADDPKDGGVVVSRIKSILSGNPKITEIDYAHENEADRTDHRGGSTTDMQAWANECKRIFTAIWNEWGHDGKVKPAVNMTGWGTRQGRSQQMMDMLKALNSLPDVYSSSGYPPGREQTPPVKSQFTEYIRPQVDMAVAYGIKYVSIWEIGTPLSSTYDRPSYVATWAPEFVRYATSKGVIPRDFDYWNGQKAGDVDNRFAADGTTDTVVGKTEKAFFESL